ncbi:hypothetical protein PR048_030835 [Dryococelus australis]|uniref:Uncharacterized protein n=1 Tax=Dryococelus australis TaxID=614101 RepID=A0ABQ9GCU6_9NEOP|nr:hypothetical protein PR048_030835 [Dryococelus australis]
MSPLYCLKSICKRTRKDVALASTVQSRPKLEERETGSIPGWVAPRFSHVGIVPDNAAGRRIFSGVSRSPALSFRRCSVFTSLYSHPPSMTRPGIEPGSPWWEASRLTAQPPRPHRLSRPRAPRQTDAAADYYERGELGAKLRRLPSITRAVVRPGRSEFSGRARKMGWEGGTNIQHIRKRHVRTNLVARILHRRYFPHNVCVQSIQHIRKRHVRNKFRGPHTSSTIFVACILHRRYFPHNVCVQSIQHIRKRHTDLRQRPSANTGRRFRPEIRDAAGSTPKLQNTWEYRTRTVASIANSQKHTPAKRSFWWRTTRRNGTSASLSIQPITRTASGVLRDQAVYAYAHMKGTATPVHFCLLTYSVAELFSCAFTHGFRCRETFRATDGLNRLFRDLKSLTALTRQPVPRVPPLWGLFPPRRTRLTLRPSPPLTHPLSPCAPEFKERARERGRVKEET